MTKKWFQTRLITLIKPVEMCNAEYILQCALRSITVSVDNPPFMAWVIKESFSDDSELSQKVRELLLRAFKQHLILDFSKPEDCAYVSESIMRLMTSTSRTNLEELFKVILQEYRQTELGDRVYRFNKAFGYTSYSYFKDGVDGFGLNELFSNSN